MRAVDWAGNEDSNNVTISTAPACATNPVPVPTVASALFGVTLAGIAASLLRRMQRRVTA